MTMKTLLAMVAGVAVLAFATTPSQGQVYLFDAEIPSGGISIPDGDFNGAAIERTVSGSGVTQIGSISITISISDGFNGDLYMSLLYGEPSASSPTAIILNRVGRTSSSPSGYDDSGFFNVTFSNDAVNDIHTYRDVQDPGSGNPLFGGTWLPSARIADGVFNVTDQTPRDPNYDFSTFYGLPADSTWTLFIADLSDGGGISILDNWIMEFVQVPEPSPVHLALAGGLFLTGLAVWRRRRLGTV